MNATAKALSKHQNAAAAVAAAAAAWIAAEAANDAVAAEAAYVVFDKALSAECRAARGAFADKGNQ
jgi:hypothetical protein